MSQPWRRPPLYARVLRLRHLRPSGLWCFLYFEGAIALGVLLALAEVVNWWAVLALPAAVAAMVKLNDLLAGLQLGRGPTERHPGGGPATTGPAKSGVVPAPRTGSRLGQESPAPGPPGQSVGQSAQVRPVSPPGEAGPGRGGRPVSRDVAGALDPVDSPRQRSRQSARRRYED